MQASWPEGVARSTQRKLFSGDCLMFFHIDESGNTGMNLFDANQRRLSYGVLSSRLNVDALGKRAHREMAERLGVSSLHANEMGVGGLAKIEDVLHALQKRFRFGFDYYYIDKPVHALVVLFDAVFDAGINDAVKWDLYWTPLRFVAITNLARIVDEGLLKEAWGLCTARKTKALPERVVALLRELKAHTEESELDGRTKELFADAFEFGIRNPMDLDFGVTHTKLVSPNAVGFQFVVRAIARRARKGGNGPVSIKVDRQQQFNKAQIETHDLLTAIGEGIRSASAEERAFYFHHPLLRDMDRKDLELKGMPIKVPEVSSSSASIGLQIVDLYLWTTNRLLRGEDLPTGMREVARLFLKDAVIDSISMEGMAERWRQFERGLTAFEDLSEEQLRMAQASVEDHRVKVAGLWDGE